MMSTESEDNLIEMRSKIAECEEILSQLSEESFAKEKVAAVNDILRRNHKIIEELAPESKEDRSVRMQELNSNLGEVIRLYQEIGKQAAAAQQS